ncbi:MAG: SurA N-terminal domain-containing protein, partial [Gammaproteobacteria bacterium]|nr:SurA N-terminal domain-containing protein [Gammaproteobacteria bacterium]
MLQSIRDNLNGWVVWLLFIVIALAFALWGVPSTVTGNTAPAEVNGEEIPLNEIRRAYRNQLLQFQQFSDVTPEQEKAIQAQVLQGLVMDEVIAQHTREAGYHIGNEALVGHIRNMTEFQDEGQFSMELFQNRLIPQGLSVQYFEAQVRRALRISQLRRGIIDTAFVTDEELTHRIRLEREQRNAEWLRLKVDPAAENLEVSEEEIVAYYESNQSRFMRPESVDLQFVVLNLGDLAAETTVSDEDLQEYYDKEVEQGRFQAPEEREASHVLIAVDGDTSDDQASAKAQELLAQINDGADFAAIAKEHSDDPGSGPEGGSLGWSPREAYVGPFADALFSMTAGEVRGPIRTQFGYHIILMQDQRGGIAKPFAEVKAELLSELSRSRAEDEYYGIAEEMADLAFENPSTLDPIATELGLELQTASSVTRTAQPEVLAV